MASAVRRSAAVVHSFNSQEQIFLRCAHVPLTPMFKSHQM